MKLKRILSSALVVVMLFGAVSVALPTRVEAAHSSSVATESKYTQEQIKEIVKKSQQNVYSSAQEMLDEEIKLGYIDSMASATGNHTIYLNRYTGVMYYKNNLTGEILTSNPYNMTGASSAEIRSNLMSQLFITFHESSNSTNTQTYNSSDWAAQYAQINVSPISNGLRVNYTLGDTTTRFVVPGAILATDYVENILKPMLKVYEELLVQYCGTELAGEQLDFFATGSYNGSSIWNESMPGVVNQAALEEYLLETKNAYIRLYPVSTGSERTALDSVQKNVMTLSLHYSPDYEWHDAELGYRYKYTKTSVSDKRQDSTTIRLYCPEYSLQQALIDEQAAGYKNEIEQKPVFRMALEYTFNEDESLSVRLPANSITFDETVYTLDSISSMRYFGAGDVTKDGYVFVPDGSGSIIEFSDFYNNNQKQNVSLTLRMYGEDYCYSMLDPAAAHREQITMPVFGVVSTTNTYGAEGEVTGEYKGGYFAVLEEGSSLASLQVEFGGGYHRAANVYTTFKPFPSDQYDLSDTISVGGAKSYTMVSKSKYTGSYVTRYVLLSDASNAAAAGAGYVPASYTGMASYYRTYLESRGQITPLTDAEADLPLYIEAFGSMDVVKRILTFPVTTSIPLTTFENITTMYDELADAKNVLLAKATEYDTLAAEYEASKELTLSENAKAKADDYRELAARVYNITNVNFKLTGFSNGGMYFTYPTKVKWENACGGKSGFNRLLDDVKERQAQGKNFNVYPDFDFLYINNTALFDGIGNKGTVSKMVDNRYASKQTFNSILREYESIFAMVISADALDGLYDKFIKSYTKYEISNISVSTLGSELNSNFDEDNPINREEASSYVVALLDRMVTENNFSVMTSRGNIYSVKYADHIIDIVTDSSHFSYSSYSIPFTGLVLHGYVNYAGSALNYSGSPDYDILHAIENGASLYYILSYQNSEYMKEDLVLNDYYGVDYENWYDEVVDNYAKLNVAIGKYKTYNIVDHTVLIAERIADENEEAANLEKLREELVDMAREQILSKVDDAYESMAQDPANVGRGVKVIFNTDELLVQATEVINVTMEELLATDFDELLLALKTELEAEYAGTSENPATVVFGRVEYNTQYEYVTDSYATDGKNYDYTDFTVDNNLVTMVTYKDRVTGDTVRFLINYNIYSVRVNLDGTIYELDKYDFEPITTGGAQNG